MNVRAHERFRPDPMNTSVQIRRPAGEYAQLEGHVYDLSEAGARLEIDEALAPGELVELMIRLPGETAPVIATGSVVWVHDADDDPAARRLAVRFVGFGSDTERRRLVRHLSCGMLRRAA